MRNDELAKIFDEIADMLEIRGDNFYHRRAYRLAADGMRDFPEPIELLPRDQLQKIRGVGPNLASKLAVLLDTIGNLNLLVASSELESVKRHFLESPDTSSNLP